MLHIIEVVAYWLVPVVLTICLLTWPGLVASPFYQSTRSPLDDWMVRWLIAAILITLLWIIAFAL